MCQSSGRIVQRGNKYVIKHNCLVFKWLIELFIASSSFLMVSLQLSCVISPSSILGSNLMGRRWVTVAPGGSIIASRHASCHGNQLTEGFFVMRRREQRKWGRWGTGTDQRGAAGASAQRLVKGRAAELQLLQVTVWDPDVSRQWQALVQVLKGNKSKTLSCDLKYQLNITS